MASQLIHIMELQELAKLKECPNKNKCSTQPCFHQLVFKIGEDILYYDFMSFERKISHLEWKILFSNIKWLMENTSIELLSKPEYHMKISLLFTHIVRIIETQNKKHGVFPHSKEFYAVLAHYVMLECNVLVSSPSERLIKMHIQKRLVSSFTSLLYDSNRRLTKNITSCNNAALLNVLFIFTLAYKECNKEQNDYLEYMAVIIIKNLDMMGVFENFAMEQECFSVQKMLQFPHFRIIYRFFQVCNNNVQLTDFLAVDKNSTVDISQIEADNGGLDYEDDSPVVNIPHRINEIMLKPKDTKYIMYFLNALATPAVDWQKPNSLEEDTQILVMPSVNITTTNIILDEVPEPNVNHSDSNQSQLLGHNINVLWATEETTDEQIDTLEPLESFVAPPGIHIQPENYESELHEPAKIVLRYKGVVPSPLEDVTQPHIDFTPSFPDTIEITPVLEEPYLHIPNITKTDFHFGLLFIKPSTLHENADDVLHPLLYIPPPSDSGLSDTHPEELQTSVCTKTAFSMGLRYTEPHRLPDLPIELLGEYVPKTETMYHCLYIEHKTLPMFHIEDTTLAGSELAMIFTEGAHCDSLQVLELPSLNTILLPVLNTIPNHYETNFVIPGFQMTACFVTQSLVLSNMVKACTNQICTYLPLRYVDEPLEVLENIPSGLPKTVPVAISEHKPNYRLHRTSQNTIDVCQASLPCTYVIKIPLDKMSEEFCKLVFSKKGRIFTPIPIMAVEPLNDFDDEDKQLERPHLVNEIINMLDEKVSEDNLRLLATTAGQFPKIIGGNRSKKRRRRSSGFRRRRVKTNSKSKVNKVYAEDTLDEGITFVEHCRQDINKITVCCTTPPNSITTVPTTNETIPQSEEMKLKTIPFKKRKSYRESDEFEPTMSVAPKTKKARKSFESTEECRRVTRSVTANLKLGSPRISRSQSLCALDDADADALVYSVTEEYEDFKNKSEILSDKKPSKNAVHKIGKDVNLCEKIKMPKVSNPKTDLQKTIDDQFQPVTCKEVKEALPQVIGAKIDKSTMDNNKSVEKVSSSSKKCENQQDSAIDVGEEETTSKRLKKKDTIYRRKHNTPIQKKKKYEIEKNEDNQEKIDIIEMGVIDKTNDFKAKYKQNDCGKVTSGNHQNDNKLTKRTTKDTEDSRTNISDQEYKEIQKDSGMKCETFDFRHLTERQLIKKTKIIEGEHRKMQDKVKNIAENIKENSNGKKIKEAVQEEDLTIKTAARKTKQHKIIDNDETKNNKVGAHEENVPEPDDVQENTKLRKRKACHQMNTNKLNTADNYKEIKTDHLETEKKDADFHQLIKSHTSKKVDKIKKEDNIKNDDPYKYQDIQEETIPSLKRKNTFDLQQLEKSKTSKITTNNVTVVYEEKKKDVTPDVKKVVKVTDILQKEDKSVEINSLNKTKKSVQIKKTVDPVKEVTTINQFTEQSVQKIKKCTKGKEEVKETQKQESTALKQEEIKVLEGKSSMTHSNKDTKVEVKAVALKKTQDELTNRDTIHSDECLEAMKHNEKTDKKNIKDPALLHQKEDQTEKQTLKSTKMGDVKSKEDNKATNVELYVEKVTKKRKRDIVGTNETSTLHKKVDELTKKCLAKKTKRVTFQLLDDFSNDDTSTATFQTNMKQSKLHIDSVSEINDGNLTTEVTSKDVEIQDQNFKQSNDIPPKKIGDKGNSVSKNTEIIELDTCLMKSSLQDEEPIIQTDKNEEQSMKMKIETFDDKGNSVSKDTEISKLDSCLMKSSLEDEQPIIQTDQNEEQIILSSEGEQIVTEFEKIEQLIASTNEQLVAVSNTNQELNTLIESEELVTLSNESKQILASFDENKQLLALSDPNNHLSTSSEDIMGQYEEIVTPEFESTSDIYMIQELGLAFALAKDQISVASMLEGVMQNTALLEIEQSSNVQSIKDIEVTTISKELENAATEYEARSFFEESCGSDSASRSKDQMEMDDENLPYAAIEEISETLPCVMTFDKECPDLIGNCAKVIVERVPDLNMEESDIIGESQHDTFEISPTGDNINLINKILQSDLNESVIVEMVNDSSAILENLVRDYDCKPIQQKKSPAKVKHRTKSFNEIIRSLENIKTNELLAKTSPSSVIFSDPDAPTTTSHSYSDISDPCLDSICKDDQLQSFVVDDPKLSPLGFSEFCNEVECDFLNYLTDPIDIQYKPPPETLINCRRTSRKNSPKKHIPKKIFDNISWEEDFMQEDVRSKTSIDTHFSTDSNVNVVKGTTGVTENESVITTAEFQAVDSGIENVCEIPKSECEVIKIKHAVTQNQCDVPADICKATQSKNEIMPTSSTLIKSKCESTKSFCEDTKNNSEVTKTECEIKPMKHRRIMDPISHEYDSYKNKYNKTQINHVDFNKPSFDFPTNLRKRKYDDVLNLSTEPIKKRLVEISPITNPENNKVSMRNRTKNENVNEVLEDLRNKTYHRTNKSFQNIYEKPEMRRNSLFDGTSEKTKILEECERRNRIFDDMYKTDKYTEERDKYQRLHDEYKDNKYYEMERKQPPNDKFNVTILAPTEDNGKIHATKLIEIKTRIRKYYHDDEKPSRDIADHTLSSSDSSPTESITSSPNDCDVEDLRVKKSYKRRKRTDFTSIEKLLQNTPTYERSYSPIHEDMYPPVQVYVQANMSVPMQVNVSVPTQVNVSGPTQVNISSGTTQDNISVLTHTNIPTQVNVSLPAHSSRTGSSHVNISGPGSSQIGVSAGESSQINLSGPGSSHINVSCSGSSQRPRSGSSHSSNRSRSRVNTPRSRLTHANNISSEKSLHKSKFAESGQLHPSHLLHNSMPRSEMLHNNISASGSYASQPRIYQQPGLAHNMTKVSGNNVYRTELPHTSVSHPNIHVEPRSFQQPELPQVKVYSSGLPHTNMPCPRSSLESGFNISEPRSSHVNIYGSGSSQVTVSPPELSHDYISGPRSSHFSMSRPGSLYVSEQPSVNIPVTSLPQPSTRINLPNRTLPLSTDNKSSQDIKTSSNVCVVNPILRTLSNEQSRTASDQLRTSRQRTNESLAPIRLHNTAHYTGQHLYAVNRPQCCVTATCRQPTENRQPRPLQNADLSRGQFSYRPRPLFPITVRQPGDAGIYTASDLLLMQYRRRLRSGLPLQRPIELNFRCAPTSFSVRARSAFLSAHIGLGSPLLTSIRGMRNRAIVQRPGSTNDCFFGFPPLIMFRINRSRNNSDDDRAWLARIESQVPNALDDRNVFGSP